MEGGLIILRPRQRTAFLQLLALGGLAAGAVVLAMLLGERNTVFVVGVIATIAIGGTSAYYRYWLGWQAPQAIVATREYVAVLNRAGDRAYVPWPAITAANHATTVGGMRWYLHTADNVTTLCDIGLHSDRWGLLWRVIWPEVARRGAPVRVDAVGNALFG